jgi:hypothetical protein
MREGSRKPEWALSRTDYVWPQSYEERLWRTQARRFRGEAANLFALHGAEDRIRVPGFAARFASCRRRLTVVYAATVADLTLGLGADS